MRSEMSPEERVPLEHPLRSIHLMVDTALREVVPQFHTLYAHTG